MSSFCQTELSRALAEQHFGIVAYHIDELPCTNEAAFASVDLLEQCQVRVRLSYSGYEVASGGKSDQIFETIEDLLSTISPKYAHRRAEELMARLEKLANAQP